MVYYSFGLIWQYIEVFKHDYLFNDLIHLNRGLISSFLSSTLIHTCVTPYKLDIFFCELFIQTNLYQQVNITNCTDSTSTS